MSTAVQSHPRAEPDVLALPLDRRVNVLAVAWCLNTFAISITYPFLPIYLNKERGFPMETVGIIFLLMGAGRISGPLLAGQLVDLLGRRTVLVAGPMLHGIVVWILAALVAGAASFWTLAGMIFFTTFFGSFFSNAADTYMTDITLPAQRSEAFARVRVGLNTGWMIGPALGAFMARTPFAQLFMLTGVFCFITALMSFIYCKSTPQEMSSAARGSTGARSFRHHFMQDRAFQLFLLYCFLMLLTASQLSTTLSIYAADVVGVKETRLGLLYTLNGLLVILLQLPLSRSLERISLGLRMMLGALLFAVGYGCLGFCVSWAQMLGAVTLFTLGEILALPAVNSVCSRMAPPDMVGRYMSMYYLVFGVAYSLGPFLGARLFACYRDQPTLLWGLLSIGAVLGAAGYLRMHCAAAQAEESQIPDHEPKQLDQVDQVD